MAAKKVKVNKVTYTQTDSGWVDPNGVPVPPNSKLKRILDKHASGNKGMIDRAKSAISKAIGGPLATATRTDPNAGTLRKAGATVGAGLGRAMAAAGRGLMKRDAQKRAPGREGPKPIPGPTHSELKMLQSRALSGDSGSARELVVRLSDLYKKQYDVEDFSASAGKVLKRSDIKKTDPALYKKLVQRTRALQSKTFEHINKVLEAAGITWNDLGFTVVMSESQADCVWLIENEIVTESTSDKELAEIIHLSGIRTGS